MIKYILCFLPFLAFAQAPSPISNSHIIVYPGYGKLAEIKPDVEYKVPFAKKEDYKDIVFHRSQYDTAAEYELFFTLKKKTTTTPVIVEQIVDDTPSSANLYMLNATTPYTGTINQPDWTKWVHFKDQGWNANHYNKTATFGYAKESYLQVSWTGYKIQWYVEKKNNHGIAAVSVDGGPEVDIDLYKNTPVNGSELVFTWPSAVVANPTNAVHTIKIRVTGTKNGAATESNVSHDFVKVFKVQ